MSRKKTFEIRFTGRARGALGISYRIVATRDAEDPEHAVLALYDEYEHIHDPVVTDVETGRTVRLRSPATPSTHNATKKKSTAQLDREIAEALARRRRPGLAPTKPSKPQTHHAIRAGAAKAAKLPDPKKTLKEIALIAFPNYKGRKIRLEEATHVERQVEGGGTFYRDFLVGLYPRHVQPVEQPHAFRGSGTKSTEIPFGFAYVSQGVFMGSDTGIRIYLPPIDEGAMSVAVDAMLAAGGKLTPAVLATIESAIGVPGPNLHRDAYVALAAQRAGALSSAEASASYG